jgi:hypothetical protein
MIHMVMRVTMYIDEVTEVMESIEVTTMMRTMDIMADMSTDHIMGAISLRL